MNTFAGLYEIRDARPTDNNFIISTFLRGIYYGDSWFSLIPQRIFMDNYKKVAESLANGNNTVVKVACLPDDPDVIIGYSILSKDFQTIHFVFVKSIWRNKGIARSLCPQYPTSVTHLTKVGKSLLNKFQGVIFNPFAL